ncbi:MAG TPA: DUF4431 domain-containing protein [Candidatus Angelobacter sp.]|nr:DUF4431 domain-containing protein [Candidatus Angelobacter sp.]
MFGSATAGLGQTTASSRCLSYEPSVVTLTGTLVSKTFPGPPNYEDVRHRDKPETYWFLKLSNPVCVDEDKAQPDLNPVHKDIRTVQLAVFSELYKKYKYMVGGRVVATGTLFGEHTAHHRACFVNRSEPGKS